MKDKKLAKKDILVSDWDCKYSFKQDINDFINFMKSNIGLILANIFFILLAYGIKLFQYSISFDTDTMIYDQDMTLNWWISIGRYGLVLLKYILGTTMFTPYAATFLTLCALLLLLLLLCFCFHYFYISNKVVDMKEDSKKWMMGCIVFSAIFITSPILTEQFNFLLQSFEVAMAMIMSVIAAFLLTKWSSCKNISDNLLYLILGILFLTLSIASYQSIMFFFVSATASFFIMKYLGEQKNNLHDVRYGLIILKQISAFIISSFIYLVTNKIIQHIFNQKSSYLDERFLWGKIPTRECLNNIFLYFKNVMLGESLFHTKWLLVLTLILGVIYLKIMLGCYQQKSMFTIGILIFLLSPFLLSFYLGNFALVRTQLSLSFVFAVEAMIIVMFIDKGWLKNTFVLLFFVIAFKQGYVVDKLFYGEQMQYEKTVAVLNNIACKIGELGLGEVPNKPVVFCGAYHAPETCTTFKGELLGYLFLEELGYHIRKNYVMNIIGYPYILPSQEQINYATNEAKNLPSYPSEGYVKDLGEVIVVKLSD